MRIGVDLGGTKIEAIALDTSGEVLARRRVATPRDDYDATVRAVADARLLRRLGGLGHPAAIARGR